MEILKYSKTQIGFFILLVFMSFLFVKDGKRLNDKTKKKKCNPYFDVLFVTAEISMFFDGLTAYTVNKLDIIPSWFNMLAHLIYLLSFQTFIFAHFMYWLSITDSIPRKCWKKVGCYAPITLSCITTIVFIPKIEYKIGEYTNYSAGVSAYVCFITITLYSILTLVVFFKRRDYVRNNRKTAFIVALSSVCIITVIQMLYSETLVSSAGIMLVVLCIYLCMENPTIKYLELYHDEMVLGFATLVDSKDGSTGGHIRRSSEYAVIIAKEMRKNPKYRKIITKDYLDNLKNAAPMHDIGKMGIPDSILKKNSNLTEEEFEIIRNHPQMGSQIIKKTFGHLDDEQYENMAYKVALYHHEKWNGTGYPNGYKGLGIPLCARIMAVADVFDAISAKRCYREALPIETCYEIIRKDRGEAFDPDVVDAFFAARKEIERVCEALREN